ncbi:MAG: tetratricopeptide repeat protein [Candidatus Helarchaeota archaeon]
MAAETWFFKGIKNMYLKNFENAILNFSKSIKINPNKSNPWYNLGIAYLHINLDPIYNNIFYLINFLFLKSNPYYLEDKIIQCFKNALKYNPKSVDAWHNLGLFYFEIENFDDAIKCFTKILKIEPRNAEALYNLSMIYQELKNFSNELEILKKITELEARNPSIPMKVIIKRIKQLQNLFYK